MKPWTRLAIPVASVVLLVVLFLLLRPGDDDSNGVGPSVIEVTYRDGTVQGPTSFTATQGDAVRIVIDADVSDEVHVHGYDLMADVTPDDPATIDFVANAPGVFEVELEDAGTLLFELEIVP
jgi:hypothetical protein